MNALTVKLCLTRDRRPLAVVDGLPGGDAELTPAQLRALAATLLEIAADAEAVPTGARKYVARRVKYDIGLKGGKP